jgi:hypothetical protein
MAITTYNSRTGNNGQRLNLVVNEDTKEFYFATHNTFNKGNVEDGLGAREVKNIRDNLIMNGYNNVNWETVNNW